MTKIAETAVVDSSAQLGNDVIVGPGCVVGAGSVIGDGCELKANVFISGGVVLGKGNRLFANCVLGEEPQSLGCVEPETKLIIGDANVFRENVTINRGTPEGGGQTVIGNNNYFMIGSHIGHDCEVEDHNVIGNYTQIGGHGKIEGNTWLSAFTGTHQFVTIGRFTFTGGQCGCFHDVPPFMRASGIYPCEIRGVNTTGLQRAHFGGESIEALKAAYRSLYRRRNGRTMAQALEELEAREGLDENVRYLVDFLQRASRHRMGRYRELARH
ncbi:acyl-ACP--UDP-N-acetylglucosamine O-acyltransferase [Planctomycetota bacterium]